MRQIAHVHVATLAAAIAMSCALPYATRANLDPSGGEEARPRIASEMPGAAPVEFVGIVSGRFNSDRQSIDLSIFTPHGFLDLSKNLKKDIAWPSVNLPVIASKPAAPAKNMQASLGDVLTSPYQGNSGERIAFSKPVLAPVAFVQFCMRYPDDCKESPSGLDHAPVQLTKERWAELTKINRDVNHAIRPQANPDGAMGERWLIAPRYGDCNDYAVTKRHELLARGWPAHSLLLTEVAVAVGEHHLVVVVRTNEDDFVLDNLSTNVRPVSQITYQWVRAQRADNPKFWATINVSRADHVAMNSR